MYQRFYEDDGLSTSVSLQPPDEAMIQQMASDPEPVAPAITARPLTKEEIREQNIENVRKAKEPAHMKWRAKMGDSHAAKLQLPDRLSYNSYVPYRWALVSYIDSKYYRTISHGDRRYKGRILKISGVFHHKPDAQAWSSILLKQNPHFMIHLVPFFEWTPVDDACECTTAARDKAITTIVLKEYVNSQEQAKNQMQRRLEASVLTKDFTEKVQLDPKAFPTHQPRPDRDEEACNFFARVQYEQSHPEQFRLPTPKESALSIGFEDALKEENIAKMKERGVVLALHNDDPTGSIPKEFIDAYRFIVISYLQPEDYAANRNNIVLTYKEPRDSDATQVNFSGHMVRPRGAFETYEDADKYANCLVEEEKIVDVYVVENFKWAPMDEYEEDQRNYQDAEIKTLIDGYHTQQKELHSTLNMRLKNACKIQAPMFELDPKTGEMKPRTKKVIEDAATTAS